MAESLVRVYLGPDVVVSQLTEEQRASAAAFLERLADEMMLVDIEENLRKTHRGHHR
jgi:hypothetical protein